jgi:hypothetical protein
MLIVKLRGGRPGLEWNYICERLRFHRLYDGIAMLEKSTRSSASLSLLVRVFPLGGQGLVDSVGKNNVLLEKKKTAPEATG